MSARTNTYAASRAKANGTITTEKSSVIFWILIGFVGLFMFWAPFQRALFNGGSYDFERSIYSASVWSSIILLLIAILAFFVYKLKEQKDVLTILVLLMPLTYIISLANAASHYLATNMVYIQMLYATFFILGVFLTKNKLGTSITAGILMISGYVIVIFGLLYWFGNGNFAGHLVSWFALMDGSNPFKYRDAIMSDSNGFRLTSVFQYANTYAAFLIMLFLGSLFFIVKSRKWYLVLPHALMMVPMIVSFWLTLSRGAIVVIPVIFLIMLFFLSISRQISALVQLGLAFAASLIILQKITDIGTVLQKQPTASGSWNGWSILLLTSVVFAALAIVIQRYGAPWLERITARFADKKFANFTLPVAAIVVGLLGAFILLSDTGLKNVLPENVKTRLANINFQQHSVLERGTFYKDAVKLWSDYPIIGAGGGAWASLYEKYQNNPYTSRQAHNFALQYLVEAGALGFLAFIGFVIAVMVFYIRSYIKSTEEKRDMHFLFFIVTVSLLVHSMIDFDLSYVYLGAVLFLALGAMLSNSSTAPLSLKSKSVALHKAFPALLAVISVVMFYVSAQLVSANSSYKQSLEVVKKSQDYNQIVAPLDKAIALHPAHPDYLLTGQISRIGILLQVYNQMKTEDPTKSETYFDQAQDLLNQLIVKEPHNRVIAFQQLNMLIMKDKQQEALDWTTTQLPNYPWYIDLYEKNMALNIELANIARGKNDAQNFNRRLDGVLETYKEFLQKIDSLKSLPAGQLQGREFAVTPSIALNVSQVYFMRGDYAGAGNVIKPYVKDQFDDQMNRVIARWYLAALQKQGTMDQALLDKLIAKDPNEKQSIDTVTTTNFQIK
ncbi:O-antigen ligase domain-containing protein [Paenibacillus sp. SYP-B3998]|uniref:O-antigen ligase domain-containing protein n=1 Tax=Paenibacillus sp. SYP-B3998 TaxID=2678564 RepID=A0A6G3ZXY3_9BACL|nr:O-antigen ligase family protein [Paenibacillus sp. SYP-B3998]NEW07073.1 O-antigen ligase domain-containing protein [Paenibacillus sp. SYP-B3998]